MKKKFVVVVACVLMLSNALMLLDSSVPDREEYLFFSFWSVLAVLIGIYGLTHKPRLTEAIAEKYNKLFEETGDMKYKKWAENAQLPHMKAVQFWIPLSFLVMGILTFLKYQILN